MPRPLHKAWEHLVVYPNTGAHEASAAERAHKVHKFMKSKRRAVKFWRFIKELYAFVIGFKKPHMYPRRRE